MDSQLSENTVYTNKGFSTYHGLLVSLQKNMSHGLRFDTNYTWSHAMDNVSLIANAGAAGGYGFICDPLRMRLCRGNSDFDATHILTNDFTYQLPFGRGRAFASNIPWVVNEFIGGGTSAASCSIRVARHLRRLECIRPGLLQQRSRDLHRKQKCHPPWGA